MVDFIQSREEFEQRLVIMHTQEGWKIRVLVRHFGVGRNTVRQILREHEKRRDQGHDILLKDSPSRKAVRASKVDIHEKRIKQLLEKYPPHYRAKDL